MARTYHENYLKSNWFEDFFMCSKESYIKKDFKLFGKIISILITMQFFKKYYPTKNNLNTT